MWAFCCPHPDDRQNFSSSCPYIEDVLIKSVRFMKKIDVLNFITDFRKAPNDIKTYRQMVEHLGAANEGLIQQYISELQQQRVIRETELNGQKAYQVVAR